MNSNHQITGIEDTVAGIQKDGTGEYAEITRLNGCVGSSSIRLYLTSSEFRMVTVEMRPYFGMRMKIRKNYNMIEVTSTHILTPLTKKDHFHLLFANGDQMRFDILTSGKVGSGRIGWSFFSDVQFLHFLNNPLAIVHAFNSRIGVYQSFDFSSVPNQQYTSAKEGQALFQIAAKRLSGLKLLLK